MSSKASSGVALGLADVDREARLAAGPVEVDRVGAAAAAADRDVEAGEAVVELAGEAGGGAGEALVVLGGDDHGDLGRDLAVLGRRQRARGQRAQRPHRQGQDPFAPLARLRRPRRDPQHQHAGAAVEVGAELGGAGDDVAAVGHPRGRARSATKTLATSSLSHSGERERSSSSASSVVTMRAIAGSGGALAR